MSQDPQPGYNPNLEKPYTDPSSYELPLPSPAEVPPWPNPDRDPPQTYYGEYQQPRYSVPSQGASGMPGYNPNHSGYNPNQSNYGYGAASSPLPLSEAINQLPNQYIKVLTKPSPHTFVPEVGKASWDILWVQLIGYAVIASVLAYLHMQLYGLGTYNAPDTASAQIFSILQATTQFLVYSEIAIIPVSFFIGQGLIYLLAKAFGGNGTFLRQAYAYLLIMVPIGIVSSVFDLMQPLGGLLAVGLGIYGIVLQILSLMSVHRLSGGKATATVLIPIAAAILLGIILGIVLAVVLITAFSS